MSSDLSGNCRNGYDKIETRPEDFEIVVGDGQIPCQSETSEALVKFKTVDQDMKRIQAALLGRVAAQDRDALNAFYDQTARPLFSFAYRMLADPEDAEEVIQDVFVQIWAKAGNFDAKKGQAFHWVLALTRNRCIDRLRARQRRARIMVDARGEPQLDQAVELAPGNAPFTENEKAEIQSAVNNLPTEQWQAIEMAFFEGMTHQEIAESLNEPLGTIKARIRRGMLKLREALQTDYDFRTPAGACEPIRCRSVVALGTTSL